LERRFGSEVRFGGGCVRRFFKKQSRQVFGGSRFIDNTRRQCAERQAVEFCAGRIFYKYTAAGALHVAYAARAIASASGQDDGHGIGPEVLRQRTQESIDRQREAVHPLLLTEKKPA